MRAEELKELLGELVEWRPEGGVASVYFEIDPADRSEGWRIALRDALRGLPNGFADRVLARFPANSPLPEGVTQAGFLDKSGEREVWRSFQIPGVGTQAFHGERPHLAPLVKILDDAWPVGVVVVALENVRVFEWALGKIDELEGWELEITSLDWRERKSPVQSPGGNGTGITASGRDQYRQRLEHNRERFLKNAGHLVSQRYGDRSWRQIVVIGEGDRAKHFAGGLGNGQAAIHEIPQDLIRASTVEIGARIEEELDHLNRSREEELLGHVEEAIGSDRGAALGPEEVIASLEQGRVRHVLFDADREWSDRDGEELREQLIRGAIATGAEVTPIEGLAASALKQHGGVAALLRY